MGSTFELLIAALDTKLNFLNEKKDQLEQDIRELSAFLNPSTLTMSNSDYGSTERLPTEILIEIFTLVLLSDSTHLSRVRLMLVCRSWYELVINVPELWSDIVFKIPRNVLAISSLTTFAGKCIERSGQLPLKISIDYTAIKSPIEFVLGTYLRESSLLISNSRGFENALESRFISTRRPSPISDEAGKICFAILDKLAGVKLENGYISSTKRLNRDPDFGSTDGFGPGFSASPAILRWQTFELIGPTMGRIWEFPGHKIWNFTYRTLKVGGGYGRLPELPAFDVSHVWERLSVRFTCRVKRTKKIRADK